MLKMTGVAVVFLQPMFKKANTSKRYSPVCQSALLRQTLKPHQLSSVSWMSAVEHHRGRGQEAGEWRCSHLMKCVSAPSSLLFDVVHKRILFEPLPPDSRLANFTLQVKGGILAGMMLTYAQNPLDTFPCRWRSCQFVANCKTNCLDMSTYFAVLLIVRNKLATSFSCRCNGLWEITQYNGLLRVPTCYRLVTDFLRGN